MFYLLIKPVLGYINTTFPQRLNKTNVCTSDRRRAGYLSSLCTVQLSDEIIERMGLPKKNEVAAEAVSFDCRTEEMDEKMGKY